MHVVAHVGSSVVVPRGLRRYRARSGRILDDEPIIATFFGIVVRMFYKEHEPAHFHAEHQSQQAKFDFSGKLLAGSIQSKTALRLIRQ